MSKLIVTKKTIEHSENPISIKIKSILFDLSYLFLSYGSIPPGDRSEMIDTSMIDILFENKQFEKLERFHLQFPDPLENIDVNLQTKQGGNAYLLMKQVTDDVMCCNYFDFRVSRVRYSKNKNKNRNRVRYSKKK